jgi:phenylacetyl-CoA:acceptor oxidoreductase subunit 2
MRVFVWLAYRRRLAGVAARGAAIALDRAGRVLQIAGTVVPLAIVVLVVAGAVSGPTILPLVALAGVAAAVAGAYVKYTLVVRAAFNQGFAIQHLPVRGARS